MKPAAPASTIHQQPGYAPCHVRFRVGRIWRKNDKFEYDSNFVKQIDAELAGSDPVDVERTT